MMKAKQSQRKRGSPTSLIASAGVGLLVLCAAGPALAQDDDDDEAEAGAPEEATGLGLSPGIPQVSALPGGFSPPYAPGEADPDKWHADFHGFLRMPLTLGVNKRSGPVTGDQNETVLHAPPRVPEYRDSFRYTSALPEPYVQLNFAYGNSRVEANVIVQARSAATAANFFDSTTRGGITDAFLTFKLPELTGDFRMQVHVGAFTNRYGIMGEYDEGRYGTPILGRTNGVGENIIALLDIGSGFAIELQQGFQGLTDTAPLGIVPGDWNDYADPNLGTSLVHHYHAGLRFREVVTLGGHFMYAFSNDDRSNQGLTPDGRIQIAGADARFTAGRWGHFYLGAGLTDAKDARSVGRVIEVNNAIGGPGLMRSYLGPDSGGTGKLTTFGGQYDMSLARMLFGKYFEGKSPDVTLSLFGMMTKVESDDADYDDHTGTKLGGEAAYSLLPWLATSFRFDHVAPNMEDNDESYSIVSPRLIFRSGWQARDQVVLQYSHWFIGDEVYVRSGSPAQIDPTINPDQDVFSLAASMWW